MTASALTKKWQRLRANGFGSGLGARILRGSIGSIAIKILATVLSLGVGITLARALGPADYGVYAFVMAAVSLAVLPVQMGLPVLIMRETAKAVAQNNKEMIGVLWRWGTRNVVLIAAGMVLIALFLLWAMKGSISEAKHAAFLCALPLLPLMGLNALRGGALRGLHHVLLGQLPDSVLRQAFLLAAIGLVFIFIPDFAITPADVMVLQSMAVAVAFIVGAGMLWFYRPANITGGTLTRETSRQLFGAALPLAMLAGMQVVNKQVDLLMLGILGSNAEVGIYRVAMQGGQLVIFATQALWPVLMPHFASLHAKGDYRRLQRLATLGAYASTILVATATVVFILFGPFILRMAFGAEYEPAYIPLCILSVGQLFSACMGLSGAILTMTGYEKQTFRGFVIALACNIVLNMLLIPYWGMTGAAVAVSASLAILNIIVWRSARKHLGLNMDILATFRQRPVR